MDFGLDSCEKVAYGSNKCVYIWYRCTVYVGLLYVFCMCMCRFTCICVYVCGYVIDGVLQHLQLLEISRARTARANVH
mgnify:CR=1 FL=1